MKITTFIGNDYHDVTLTDAKSESAAQIEAKSESDAIALATGIADLLALHTNLNLTVATERESFTYGRVAELVEPTVGMSRTSKQPARLDPVHRESDLDHGDITSEDRLPA